MHCVEFTLNGQPVSLEAEEGLTALSALRNRLGITTLKDGCSPEGRCGCCTIHVDGRPTLTCKTTLAALAGRQVLTQEGLEQHKRQVLARAFQKTGGLQCGFCTPGIAMRLSWLLDRKEQVDIDDVRQALAPHICRCTGYTKLVEAGLEAAAHWRTDTLPELPQDARLGDPAPRYQGEAAVMGEKTFVDDLSLPDMLEGAVRLTEHPRARILAIDTEAARAMPGVHAVITAKNVPGQRLIGHIRPDWPVFVAVGELTHCIGSCLAAVAADTREQARAAADAIIVSYQVLEPLTDVHQALLPDAPQVHATRPNHAATCVVRRGDLDAARAASVHVVTETFQTQRIEHAFLEPESAVAVPEVDGGVFVYTEGQGVHEDQRQIAEALDLHRDKVQVQLLSNGGGFGGKEDLSIQQHAALLALRCGRPVKLTLPREQSMRLHPKRHPLELRYQAGCDAEGRLTFVHARIWGDTGGYLSVGDKVLERAAGHSCGPYRVPAVDVEAITVYTNNPTCGAFRGFGANQAAFAIEGVLDRLAEQVGIDGYDIRERNVLGPGDPFATGQLMDSGCGVRQTLEAVRDLYKSHPGAGIACAIKNTGIGNGMADTGRALIRVDTPEHLTVYTGFTEMGQGLMTVLRQVVHHETGLPVDAIDVEVSTKYAVECGMTTASRATMLAGEATRRAAVALRQALGGRRLSDLEGQEFPGEFICDFTVQPGADDNPNPVTHVTFGYATQVVLLDEAGRLRKVVAVHDVGRVMNRSTCEGQVQGAIHMGLGYALTEDLPTLGGHLLSTKLADLHILSAKQTPEIEVHLLEVPDPHSEYGVKGVGEIGLVPTAPAVAAALHHHDGIWRNRLPMRGSAAARALLPKRMHEEDHA